MQLWWQLRTTSSQQHGMNLKAVNLQRSKHRQQQQNHDHCNIVGARAVTTACVSVVAVIKRKTNKP
jgi:hypothetical protein